MSFEIAADLRHVRGRSSQECCVEKIPFQTLLFAFMTLKFDTSGLTYVGYN